MVPKVFTKKSWSIFLELGIKCFYVTPELSSISLREGSHLHNLLVSAKSTSDILSGLHLWYPCRVAVGPLTPCQGTSAGAYSLQGSTE